MTWAGVRECSPSVLHRTLIPSITPVTPGWRRYPDGSRVLALSQPSRATSGRQPTLICVLVWKRVERACCSEHPATGAVFTFDSIADSVGRTREQRIQERCLAACELRTGDRRHLERLRYADRERVAKGPLKRRAVDTADGTRWLLNEAAVAVVAVSVRAAERGAGERLFDRSARQSEDRFSSHSKPVGCACPDRQPDHAAPHRSS